MANQSTTDPQINPTKVRFGLAIISVIFAAAALMVVIAEGTIAKSLFFAIAAMTLVRLGLLVRWLRRERGPIAPA